MKIYVVSHKKYWFPQIDNYVPIQVGNGEKFSLFRDDTDDNISNKNKNWCELTALYWIWKNDKSDFIGLCHYRRYFDFKINNIFEKVVVGLKNVAFIEKHISTNYIKQYLKDYDIILPNPICLDESILEHYGNSHNINDLLITKEVVLSLYPEYANSIEECFSQNIMYAFNMFVMPKRIFDEYMEWLFKILFEVEKRIEIPDDNYQARVFGFLAERLLNVYIYKRLKIKEVPYIFIEDNESGIKYKGFTRKVIRIIRKKFRL